MALLLWGCQVVGSAPLPGSRDVAACVSTSPVTDSVFLIGDAGSPELPRESGSDQLVEPVLVALHREVLREVSRVGSRRVATIFLGDNLYPEGLVAVGEKGRLEGERILEAQIAAAQPAPAIFVAGNHDWEEQGVAGWERVLSQGAFLGEQGDGVLMLPPAGCAGPATRDFGEHLRVVFLDPIGWQHSLIAPAVHARRCPNVGAKAVLYALAEAFENTEGRHVVLVLHHPLVTAGPHGGHFSWKQHLFPLTDFVPWLWIPLPGVGSIYPIARQLGISVSDTSSGPYRGFVRGIYRASRPTVPVLVAGGHEHSLQVHRDVVGLIYAVSGAGSTKKVNRVEQSETALMAAAVPGFMRLDVRADGSLELTVLEVEAGGGVASRFRQCVAQGAAPSGGRSSRSAAFAAPAG